MRIASKKSSRRGSVLILVVVLVVLLALMGTAMLSTTRTDRGVSTQNVANTQIDLLEKGVAEMIKSTIAAGVIGRFDSGPTSGVTPFTGYRPPTESWALGNSASTFTYTTSVAPLLIDPAVPPTVLTPELKAHYDILKKSNDVWLSPRWPTLLIPATGSPPAVSYTPAWMCLGRLPGVTAFDTPFAVDPQLPPADEHKGTINQGLPLTYTHRLSGVVAGSNTTILRFIPNYVQPNGTGPVYPAWYLPNPLVAGTGYFAVAGDADGDGIADSGLVKIGEFEGVTYYYCARIVDNNSAININTAFSQTSDFEMGTGTPQATDALGKVLTAGTSAGNLGMFRSHVGLMELLYDKVNEPLALLNYLGNTPTGPFSINPYDDTSLPSGPQQITSFNWTTRGEFLESQLARRLANPGNRAAGNMKQMQRFGMSDMSSLTYHGIFNKLDSTLSPVETIFRDALTGSSLDSLYDSSPNRTPGTGPTPNPRNRKSYPYISGIEAATIARWFDDNFYSEELDISQMVINPIQTVVPDPSNLLGAMTIDLHRNNPIGTSWSVSTTWRSPRSILTTDNPLNNQISPRYLITGATKTMPVGLPQSGSPPIAGMPAYRPDAAKTNVNTATFDELWRAYWCVMMENTKSGTPFSTLTHDKAVPYDNTKNPGGVYWGMQYDLSADNGFAADPDPLKQNQFRMFRSNLRDPRTTPVTDAVYFENEDMVKFRAAAAAVQTIQMRDYSEADVPTAQFKQKIQLPMQKGPSSASAPLVDVYLWGARPQPFLTEVFIWTGLKFAGPGGDLDPPNTNPYVAVELYNPYSMDINLDNLWHIVTQDRNSAAPYADALSNPVTLSTIFDFPAGGVTIPANGYIVLHNGMKPPPSAQASLIGGQQVLVSNLDQIIDKEMIILQENVLGAYLPGPQTAAVNPNLKELRPIDSIDLKGLGAHVGTGTNHEAWHYARACGGENRWQCVYPGRYWGDQTTLRQQGTEWTSVHPTAGAPPGGGPPGSGPDTETDDWTEGNTTIVRTPTLSADNPAGTMPASISIQLNNLDFAGPNKLPQSASSGGKYPFGSFMRDGDILSVPFIAANTILDSSGNLIDLNSVSMDAAFAEDGDPDDDFPRYMPTEKMASDPDRPFQREHVGRFAPIRIAQRMASPDMDSNMGDDLVPIDDYADGGTYDVKTYDLNKNAIPVTMRVPKWHYRWAMDLFDYLTVQSPATDYLPNISPAAHALMTPKPVDNDGDGIASHDDYSLMTPAPYGYTPLMANLGKEDAASVQGKININTAPWKVLAAIPWLPTKNSSGNVYNEFTFGPSTTIPGGPWMFYRSPNFRADGMTPIPDNEDIAKAICYWRDGDPQVATPIQGNGPFRSIFDLYKIRFPAYQNLSWPAPVAMFDELQQFWMNPNGTPPMSEVEPDDAIGDFSPYNGANPPPANNFDHSRFDYEEMFLAMTKISNLITTRSDSFTVYIQLQGWRGVGVPGKTPELVVQRRSAFIQDRSTLTPTNKTLAPAVNVANE